MNKSTAYSAVFCLFVSLAMTPTLRGQDLQSNDNSVTEADRKQMLSWYTDMQEKGSNSGREEQYYTIQLENMTYNVASDVLFNALGGGLGTVWSIADLAIGATEAAEHDKGTMLYFTVTF